VLILSQFERIVNAGNGVRRRRSRTPSPIWCRPLLRGNLQTTLAALGDPEEYLGTGRRVKQYTHPCYWIPRKCCFRMTKSRQTCSRAQSFPVRALVIHVDELLLRFLLHCEIGHEHP
jgi:hypothetical protein